MSKNNRKSPKHRKTVIYGLLLLVKSKLYLWWVSFIKESNRFVPFVVFHMEIQLYGDHGVI